MAKFLSKLVYKLSKLVQFFITVSILCKTLFGALNITNLQSLNTTLSSLNQKGENLSTIAYIFRPSPRSQTEAYLSIPELAQVVKNCYEGGLGLCPQTDMAGFKNVLNTDPEIKAIVNKVLAKEKEYKDTDFVFYHAYWSLLRVLYDFYTYMCYEEKKCDQNNPFILYRSFNDFEADGKKLSYFGLPDLNTWIDQKEKEVEGKFLYGYPAITRFDHYPTIKPFLLSNNVSLFGNIGIPGEHTFKYFLRSLSINPPDIAAILDNAISRYIKNADKRKLFVQELVKLTQPNKPGENEPTLYSNHHRGDLIQTFIPKKYIDKLAYLSKPYGRPWNKYINRTATHKFYDAVRKRYTYFSPLLSIYERDPQRFNSEYLEDTYSRYSTRLLDAFQTRLFLRGEYFERPNKFNVKMFRYSTLDPDIEKKYLAKVQDIVHRIYESRDK